MGKSGASVQLVDLENVAQLREHTTWWVMLVNGPSMVEFVAVM